MLICAHDDILYLFYTFTHTHRNTPLGDVDWATGVPWRYVMFAVELSFLCESPSGGRRRLAGRAGPLTQQQRVFERVPGDAAAAWIIRVNPQNTLDSSAHYLTVCFICFHLGVQSSYAFRHICISQPRVYSFVSNVVNNTVPALVCFTCQRMIKEKTALVLCYLLYVIVFICYMDGAAYFMSKLCPAPVRKVTSYQCSDILFTLLSTVKTVKVFLNKPFWYGLIAGIYAKRGHNYEFLWKNIGACR